MKPAIVFTSIALALVTTNYPPKVAQADQVKVAINIENIYQKQTIKFPDRTKEYKAELDRLEAIRIVEVAKVQAQAQKAVTAPAPAPSDAKMFIYLKESGNNPNAVNKSSGACGLGQALPCSKMGCALGDYACQDAFFTKYMQNRYGTWENARAFWNSHRWW